MRTAMIYSREKSLFVIPNSTTEMGFQIATEPMFRITHNDGVLVLGDAVLKAIGASKESVPQPDDLREVTKGLLRFVGQKSWSTFARDTRCLLVEGAGQKIRITPTKGDAKGGFDHLVDLSIECSAQAVDVGQLALNQLSRCR